MLNPYTTMEILSLIYLSIIFVSIVARWKNAEIPTRLFALNIFLAIIGTVCDAISIENTIHVKAAIALTFVSFLVGDCLSTIFSYYCMYQANTESKVIPVWMPRTVFIANSISIIGLSIAYARGTLFPVVNGEYTLGAAGYFLYIVEISSTIFLVTILIIYKKQLSTRVFIALLILMITPQIGGIIELLFPGLYISYSAISVSILIQYVLIQSRMISEAEMRSQIESEISRTDVMTGLQNRRAYTEYTDDNPKPACCGVMFFDVNGLKRTNDELGHSAGDNLIRTFAGLLNENLINSDLFRISGDEFIAIYIGENKRILFEKEKNAIQNAIFKNKNIAAMGSCFAENTEILKLITAAEQNMYEDKHRYYIENGMDRRKN